MTIEMKAGIIQKYRTALWIIVFLTGCASLPGIKTQEINGREVAYSSKGDGTPVVVFETGMGPTMGTWEPIFDNVAEVTRVFAYNRPGYGWSSLWPLPKTASDIIKILRENLRQTGHHPPYLLVGHSAGGLYVNMYARSYPEEVSGVVLIDSSHPSQLEYFKDEKAWLYTMFILTTSTGKTSYESKILRNIHHEFEKLGPFPDIPLVVLTAEKSSLFETPDMRKHWLQFQRDLAGMSAKSTHIIVEGSSHFIHQDRPELVIQAIKDVIKEIR